MSQKKQLMQLDLLVKACNSELNSQETQELEKIGQQFIKEKLRKRIYKLKQRAKIKNLPFDLTSDYLLDIFPTDFKCPALGTRFNWFGDRSDLPTIDRVIPEKGYVIGNVVWVSFMANLIMTYAHPTQVIKVGRFADKIYKKFYPEPYTNANNKGEDDADK